MFTLVFSRLDYGKLRLSRVICVWAQSVCPTIQMDEKITGDIAMQHERQQKVLFRSFNFMTYAFGHISSLSVIPTKVGIQ